MIEQSATLRRAMDALNSVCVKPPEKETSGPESKLPIAAKALPACSILPAAQKIAESESIPPDDPAEWREPFVRWLDSACARHPRAFGGVAALHLAYCEWEIAQKGVPCTRETFERLLGELGFLMGEVEGTVLVSGLIFRDDLEAMGL